MLAIVIGGVYKGLCRQQRETDMTATVTQLRKSKAPAATRKTNKAARVASAHQRKASYAVGGIALILTGLSLSHLANGIQMLTHSSALESRALATGIDCGFVSLEIASLCVATDGVRKQLAKLINPTIIITMILSAAMNAFSFASEAPSLWFAGASAALGCCIPAMIYVCSKVAVTLWKTA